MADGRVVNHTKINIRDLEIAGLHLSNVVATVMEGHDAPLLLGQSAIKKLGRISIDGNELTIHVADKEKFDAYALLKLADKYRITRLTSRPWNYI